MKYLLSTLALILAISITSAQTNEEIARVYINRANTAMEKIDYSGAKDFFEKAMRYSDTVKTSNVAWIGTLIYYELKEYKAARQYAKQYFALKRNKKSDEYADLLEVFVSIEEKIFEQEEIEKKKIAENRRIALENQKRDSIKSLWYSEVKNLSIKADKVDSFNKYGNAIFHSDGKYGLFDDKGFVLVKPETYITVKSHGKYTLFLNKEINPTKILVYNHEDNKGLELPNINEFNLLSTHFGEVMLPIDKGLVVAYPDNSLKVFIYDLNKRSVVGLENSKEIIKELKKSDKIQKSNKEGQVRIDKEWYFYGGNLGGGIYPLITENYAVAGFLSATTGSIIKSSQVNYLGAFSDGILQAKADDKSFWVNQSGVATDLQESDLYSYKGVTKIQLLEQGFFYLIQENHVIRQGKKLKLLEDYLNDKMNN